MRIKVTDGVLIKGKAYRRGDIVDVDNVTARMLEQMRRAELVIEAEAQAKPEPEPAKVLTTETVPFVSKQHRHKKGRL